MVDLFVTREMRESINRLAAPLFDWHRQFAGLPINRNTAKVLELCEWHSRPWRHCSELLAQPWMDALEQLALPWHARLRLLAQPMFDWY